VKKLITLLLCAVVLFGTASGFTASAEAFDSSRRGSITLHYTDENGGGLENLEIAAYRVANVQAGGYFGVLPQFSAYPVNVNNVKSQTEWKNIAETLAGYIAADDLAPYSVYGTDENGIVVMDYMENGLYLILAAYGEKDGTVYAFENFFTILPSRIGGGWNYDIEAVPKKEKYNGYLEYRVTKLWQDSENPSARPQSVEIDILRDGVLAETQILNAENNWTYCWQDIDGKGVWTVAERNVPQNYTVTVSKNENVLSVVNRYEKPQPPEKPDKPDNPTPPPEKPADSMPDTGDISNSGIYFAVMCVSGLVLVILGILTGRKRR